MTIAKNKTRMQLAGRMGSVALLCLTPAAYAAAQDAAETDEPLAQSIAHQTCLFSVEAPMMGYQELDVLAFIDAPDGDSVRVTAPIENWLAGQLVRQTIAPPLSKTYCQISLTNLVVDYHHPVDGDDAISGIAYRSIYAWTAEAEFPGWELTQFGKLHVCARGKHEETGLCL